jgi:hypothetical protein
MRDVSINEVFTWRDEFGLKAKEAFGGWRVDVSPQTYSELKQRCDRWFDSQNTLSLMPVPLNEITVHMVKTGEVPDGVLRACGCGKEVNRG